MSVEFEDSLSVNNFEWKLKSCDERLVTALQQKNNISEIIARILINRNVAIEEIDDYLNPTLKKYLPNPMDLRDMDKAAYRISEAIINQQNIVIFGDYDVDGATSSALFKRYFDLLGSNASIYIPDRIKEGYGPNPEALLKLKEKGADLIITVDCGTSSFEAIETACNINLDVIIVDHHLGNENLPKALAIVNPNRLDETSSSYRNLAAVGVSFLVLVAVNKALREKGYFKNNKEPNLLNLLDLVALGTICDVVPLDRINRAFVTQGLKILANRTNVGLSCLFDISGLSEPPNTYHLGFILGPRINAGGRIGESRLGSDLLSTNNPMLASQLAEKLNHLNSERKAIETLILDEAMLMAEKFSASPIIYIVGQNWHPGIIGIIASRLKDKHNKPTAVISLINGIGKASCRSVPKVDFGSAIVNAKLLNLVENGGGHAMAAGFTIIEEKIGELKSYLEARFSEELAKLTDANLRHFDGYLSAGGVTLELAQNIEKLGPFGSNNPEPSFLITNAQIVKSNIVAQSHINCFIKTFNSKSTIKAMAFRAVGTKLEAPLMNSFNKEIKLIASLKINRWQGAEKAELLIHDIIE
ncbi:MAG: single-stranded-DNA-specific exonuclease RecJ [Alphaproteobacteria bacterium]